MRGRRAGETCGQPLEDPEGQQDARPPSGAPPDSQKAKTPSSMGFGAAPAPAVLRIRVAGPLVDGTGGTRGRRPDRPGREGGVS